FIARTREQIIEASNSKYCPIPMNTKIKEILSTPGRYAVVGLPCQIQGLRKAEVHNKLLKERIVLHLGLACNHMPSFNATEYLLNKMQVKKEEVLSLEYRSKAKPSEMIITLEN